MRSALGPAQIKFYRSVRYRLNPSTPYALAFILPPPMQASHGLRHQRLGVEQLPSTTTWVKFQIDRDCRLRVARNAGLRFSAG